MAIHEKIVISKYSLIILVMISIIAGYFLNWSINENSNKTLNDFFKNSHALRLNKSEFKFTNPLLAYDQPESSEFEEYKPLENALNNFISTTKSEKKVNDISVYVRTLSKGRWVGINENTAYNPASLMKVPLMISYLKESENDPTILNKELTFTKSVNISAQIPFNDPSNLVEGQKYKIIDLIKSMVIDSDNGGMDLLLQTVDQNSLSETYTDLGIPNPDGINGDYSISPKTYSLFFRILYNSTYLNSKDSEFALNLLSQVKFKEGLTAKLPNNTQTSHKYGEHVISNDTGTETELHDCGIVYKNDNPYIICVMTRGQNITDLQSVIQNISELVFNNIK